MSDPVVIIGTGLAGYNLAREFRKLDSETPLLLITTCLLYTSPSPRDRQKSRMPSSA